MLRLFEQYWPGWYRDPARWGRRPGRPWGTADGCIPFPLFGLLFRAIEPALALERLNLSKGINLAFAGPEGAGPQILDDAIREAYPDA